jgi:pyruvate kinase
MIEENRRKTKIVCTIGPASESPQILESLIRGGMNVARLNFSHGTHEEHLRKINTIRQIADRLGQPVAILQDLGGPKIRIGMGSRRISDLL